MLLEITGAGFVNKGAELMLREAVRRVRENMHEVSIAVSAVCGPYMARAKLGLYQVPRYRRYGIELGKLASLMPVRYRHCLGIVTDTEIDVTLDASGYLYGDPWGPVHLRSLAHCARRGRRKGKKLILLPQAFGPFTHAWKKYLNIAVDHADLVYPRDEVSYRAIVDVVGERDHVRMVPDFTAPLPGFLRPAHDRLRGGFCVIANTRMLDMTSPDLRAAYVPLMRECVTIALQRSARPYVLIHETGDVAVARHIADGLLPEVDVVNESDPLAIKGIIGAAGAVVSSRFHGLVSALSQGVPALGTSWSHKYAMLFRDYGFPEGMVAVPSSEEELRAKLDLVLDPTSHSRVAEQLRRAAERQRDAIEAMWRDVFDILRSQ